MLRAIGGDLQDPVIVEGPGLDLLEPKGALFPMGSALAPGNIGVDSLLHRRRQADQGIDMKERGAVNVAQKRNQTAGMIAVHMGDKDSVDFFAIDPAIRQIFYHITAHIKNIFTLPDLKKDGGVATIFARRRGACPKKCNLYLLSLLVVFSYYNTDSFSLQQYIYITIKYFLKNLLTFRL